MRCRDRKAVLSAPLCLQTRKDCKRASSVEFDTLSTEKCTAGASKAIPTDYVIDLISGHLRGESLITFLGGTGA